MYSVQALQAGQASQDGLGGKGVERSAGQKAVQQIYLELLLRDPLDWKTRDPGMSGFVDCLVAGWCDIDFVRTEILKSPEFRDLQAKLATQGLDRARQSVAESSSSWLPALPSIAGVSLPVIIGGVVLLFLMKKR